jgi:ubiquinone/menaquinone biosynthesis C-methylase UbiE
MKTEWNYTNLADAYLKRPDYSDTAIDEMLLLTGLSAGAKVCDVGAGVAHLTLMLGARGYNVVAVEPNDAMRSNGILRTQKLSSVRWHEGVGEDTGQPDHAFDLVTFGSSFNVTDRLAALKETYRILKPRGWFACMWNHRNLEDPIQKSIEGIIQENIPEYGYGTRREDQTTVINDSNLFGEPHQIEGTVTHTQTIRECVEAWRSHATLERQAGDKFENIIQSIEKMLIGLGTETILIPYTTRMWVAQGR